MAELVRLQPPPRSNTNHTREKGTTMTERTFRIQTGHWHDNRGGHGMSLNIQDDLSGVTVADIRLTPEQAYDLFPKTTALEFGTREQCAEELVMMWELS